MQIRVFSIEIVTGYAKLSFSSQIYFGFLFVLVFDTTVVTHSSQGTRKYLNKNILITIWLSKFKFVSSHICIANSV